MWLRQKHQVVRDDLGLVCRRGHLRGLQVHRFWLAGAAVLAIALRETELEGTEWGIGVDVQLLGASI